MNLDVRQNFILDDIDDIIAHCSTDKLMREQCKTLSFWKPIFERNQLILPVGDGLTAPYFVNTVKDWIKLYNISSILTPLINDEKFSITVNEYDELADINIIGDLKLLDLHFPLDLDEIHNTFHLYKYLLKHTKLPYNDIISVIYDKLSNYYVDLITFYFYDEYKQWGITIHYHADEEEDYIPIMMDEKDFYKSLFVLLQHSKFQQLNFNVQVDKSYIYI